MVTLSRLQEEIDEILPGIVADRRHLHENPELGFHEYKTAALVAERLESLGVEDIRTGINSTGVTGLIRGTGTGPGADKVVLVRADMDALPIVEENQVDYVSKNAGIMHACGHDAHTATLLGLARVLMNRRDEFAGTVKVLFQPAEELPPGGAKGMIEAGVLEDPHVDYVYGLHMAQEEPLGTISVGGGPIMAAPDSFETIVQGKGGHGAYPHNCVDPVVVAAHIVVALQALVSREVDPTKNAVVSTTVFQSGDAFNVIPDVARLGGTVRTFDPEVQDLLERRIGEMTRSIAGAMGATVETTYRRGYPPTVNDEHHAEIVRKVATELLGEEKVIAAKPKMGGEDFSYFLQQRPGAFFFVGSKNEGKGLVWGHHHPRFDIDEDAMATGLEVMTRSVLTALEDGQSGSGAN